MAAVNIRDVPEVIARELKALCARRGETLRAGVLRIITEELTRNGVKLPKEVRQK